jgi:hypothetical protein
MNTTLKYSVQVITYVEQLTEAFNLRYRIYKKVYPRLFRNDSPNFESDAFDARSIHLGLYCENRNEKKLAGYCRLILPEYFENDFADWLIKDYPEYIDGIQKSSKDKMAFIERLPKESYENINSFCTNLEMKRTVYAETSRFIIEEDHRSISLCYFFVSSMMAICQSLKIRYSFFTCTHHHISFYNKLGLTLFPDILPFDNEIFGKQYVIFGTDLDIVNKNHISLKYFKLQLEKEKKITIKKIA